MPEVCLHWKNRRFTAFLDSKIHTRLAIVTANELGFAFSPRNLTKKFRPDPSTFYLVIVVTNKQTDRQTDAGDSITPRESFRGDKNRICSEITVNTTQRNAKLCRQCCELPHNIVRTRCTTIPLQIGVKPCSRQTN